MIKPAILYKEELERKFKEIFYDLKFQYYTHGTFNNIPEIPNNNEKFHCFASVDENDNVIGYISYGVDWETMTTCGFGAISFAPAGNVLFAYDLRKVIDDIFVKFNYNRVEWWAYEDNPAIRGYDAFIKRCGGRRAGYLRQNIKLMDGKIHNSIIYEILREDYMKNRGKRYDKK